MDVLWTLNKHTSLLDLLSVNLCNWIIHQVYFIYLKKTLKTSVCFHYMFKVLHASCKHKSHCFSLLYSQFLCTCLRQLLNYSSQSSLILSLISCHIYIIFTFLCSVISCFSNHSTCNKYCSKFAFFSFFFVFWISYFAFFSSF